MQYHNKHLVKSLINDKHTALLLGNGGFCKLNQRSLYIHLFNEEFDAHDALEDVRALRRILYDSPLNLSTEDIIKINNCSVDTQFISLLFSLGMTDFDELFIHKNPT